MSLPFYDALKAAYPGCNIDLIVKKELQDLTSFLPEVRRVLSLSKQDRGLFGSISFGKKIRSSDHYDLFFSLPNSFSSALIGFFSNSIIRIGYKNECRGFLLTHAYKKVGKQHRATEYLGLLEKFSGTKGASSKVSLRSKSEIQFTLPPGQNVIININSEAISRKMPIPIAEKLVMGVQGKSVVYYCPCLLAFF